MWTRYARSGIPTGTRTGQAARGAPGRRHEPTDGKPGPFLSMIQMCSLAAVSAELDRTRRGPIDTGRPVSRATAHVSTRHAGQPEVVVISLSEFVVAAGTQPVPFTPEL